MTLQDDCRVSLILADYVAVDAAQKLNVLGAGFIIAGIDPSTGMTAPQHLALLLDVPARYADTQFALTLELRQVAADTVVTVPELSGKQEALRVQQLVTATRAQVAGSYLPPDLYARIQLAMAFQNGIPLRVGAEYYWRLEVDGQHRKHWRAYFYVPGPPPGPVFGGPASPLDIPGFEGGSTSDSEDEPRPD